MNSPGFSDSPSHLEGRDLQRAAGVGTDFEALFRLSPNYYLNGITI